MKYCDNVNLNPVVLYTLLCTINDYDNLNWLIRELGIGHSNWTGFSEFYS